MIEYNIIMLFIITIIFLIGMIFYKATYDPFTKSYRKKKGGRWCKISFTYKKDMGMTRVTKTEWVTHDELELWDMCDNFKILKTEDYDI